MRNSFATEKRGMALVVVLSFLAILGLLTGVVGNQASLALAANQTSNQGDTSYYVAYGGLQRALTELRADPKWPGLTNKPFPGGDGETYSVTIIDNPDPTNPLATIYGIDLPPTTMLVVCEGKSSDSKRRVAGVINTGGTATAGFAALAGSSLLSDGGYVEAFTTTGGFAPYELTTVPGEGQIGTVSGLSELLEGHDSDTGISFPTEIDGNLACDAIDGDITTPEPSVYQMDPSTQLLGENQLTNPAAMDPPVSVTYLGGPTINKPGGGTQTLFPGHYDNLHIGDGATITLEPGDYFFKGNVELFDHSKIVTNGKVTIHVDQLFAARDHGAVNYKGDPRDCEIILTGDQPKYYWLPYSKNLTHSDPWYPGGVKWHGASADESSVWGRIRAVESRVTVSGTVYGDVQADTIRISGTPDRSSGKIMYFKDLDSGLPAASGTPASYVYDTIFNLNNGT